MTWTALQSEKSIAQMSTQESRPRGLLTARPLAYLLPILFYDDFSNQSIHLIKKEGGMNMLKSIGAILAGFIVVFLLSIGTDVALGKLGVVPTVWWMLLIALIYRSMYAAAGGFITATLAPSNPIRHAVILGTIGTIFAIFGSISNTGKITMSSVWYPLLLIILTLPSVWLGGKLKAKSAK
jgi:hypothetical protein